MRLHTTATALRLAHLALPCLFVVLVLLAAHTVWYLVENRQALKQAHRSSEISRAYVNAEKAALRAEVAVNDYIVFGSPGSAVEFRSALQEALNAAAFISQNGYEEDRQLVARLLTDHATNIAAAQALFATPPEVARQGDTGAPVVAQVTAILREQVQRSAVEAELAMDRFDQSQDRQVTVALIVFAVCLPMIFLLVVAIRWYARSEALNRAEMLRLSEEAHTDSLTGLGNHRAFQEQLQLAVERSQRLNTELSLAIVDIDDFKTINDRDGHSRGDKVLMAFARLLQDSVGAMGSAYRIGGDEFAMLMPGLTPEETEDLMETVREKTFGTLERLTVSIGIAARDEQMQDAESMRDGADLALYEAKRRGRNMVSYFSGLGGQKTVVTAGKLDSLRQILEAGQVRVAFQPIWDTEWTHVIAYEALARFPTEADLAGPLEAFELAERMGRAHELDQRCIEAVLQEAPKLPEEALLFVNISPRSFEHAGFSPRRLAEEVEDAGLHPNRVCIEISERSVAPLEIIEQRCNELRRFGFRIALDNAGASNAGLEMLNRLPVEFVKIDQKVMNGALVNSRSRAVMLALTAFAVESGAQVIAEGVESVELLALIRRTNAIGSSLRIDAMQGRLLGRPDDIALVTSTGEHLRQSAAS
jgi:diguanylate cyclase (GGDEF)-like protein